MSNGAKKTGRPLVNQSDGKPCHLINQYLSDEFGQPLVNQSVPDESKFPSRNKRTLKGLRLLTPNVEQMEVYCLINGASFADQVDRFLEAFLSGNWEPQVNQLTTCVCSVCKREIEEEEHTHIPSQLVNQSTAGRQPLIPGTGGADLVAMPARGERSKFDRKTIERFRACHFDKHGNRLRKPWTRWARETGDWDEAIEEWLEEIAHEPADTRTPRPKVGVAADTLTDYFRRELMKRPQSIAPETVEKIVEVRRLGTNGDDRTIAINVKEELSVGELEAVSDIIRLAFPDDEIKHRVVNEPRRRAEAG